MCRASQETRPPVRLTTVSCNNLAIELASRWLTGYRHSNHAPEDDVLIHGLHRTIARISFAFVRRMSAMLFPARKLATESPVFSPDAIHAWHFVAPTRLGFASRFVKSKPRIVTCSTLGVRICWTVCRCLRSKCFECARARCSVIEKKTRLVHC